ncbi:AsnC family transcriptional regulator [Ornithinimicrobium humiphilum]|uniref:AsnC family transcriptional regulator n=2 Tax=Ornithinimicrobium humiphilum TaxID=125288 RepID=A0A543KQF2_9MICO|nr:AsnC family transcriptional regulator [Ornithinimicrobium humiphilum]
MVRLHRLSCPQGSILHTVTMPSAIDELDARLLRLLEEDPHVGVLGASRALGVARGTVQSRLDKLVRRGAIRSFAPQVDPAGLGYPVMAFSTLEIRQGTRDGQVMDHLRTIPEVLEAHTITGSGDVMIRLVARDNGDLQRVIDLIDGHPLVARSSTVICLSTPIPFRTMPLVEPAASAAGR